MITKRVAILISAGGSNMVSLARAMDGDFPARPVLVVSNVPGAGGLARAQGLGIPTAIVDHRSHACRADFETHLHEKLVADQVDILCLAGFMRVLSAAFTAKWAGRCLNVHPSMLPKYKGLNTHARALAAGETQHGCTVHEVTATLDDGPILGQARVPVLSGDTPQTLGARVLAMEHLLYPAVLRRYSVGDRSSVSLRSSD